MKEWKDNKNLIKLIKEKIYTTIIGNIMDKMGYTHKFIRFAMICLLQDASCLCSKLTFAIIKPTQY